MCGLAVQCTSGALYIAMVHTVVALLTDILLVVVVKPIGAANCSEFSHC